MINVVFFGTTKLSYQCLNAIKNIVNIKLIVTTPKKFKISYNKKKINNYNYFNFKNKFSKKIDVKVVSNMKKKILLKKYQPDIIIVIGWYYNIPNYIVDNFCTIGLHGSLLPSYKGGAPLVWSLINGEKFTGVTLFKLSNKVDRGKILLQKKILIRKKEEINELLNKASKASTKILIKFLKNYKKNKELNFLKNKFNPSYFPQRKPEDGKINWSMKAIYIDRFIRAQSKPYPGAFTFLNKNKIYIFKSKIIKKLPKKYLVKENFYKKKNKIYFKSSDYFIQPIKYLIKNENKSK